MIVKGTFYRLNRFNVQWQIGNFCNYKCSYCEPKFRDGTKPFLPVELAKRIVLNIVSKVPTKNVIFNYQGGEPTAYRDFEELLKFTFDNEARSMMVSNASRSVAYLTRIAPYLSFSYLTFHSDMVDIDTFLERLHVFHPRRCLVYLPMNPALWDKCVDAHRRITEANYRVVAKVIFEDYGGGHANTSVPYTEEQNKFIDDCNRNLLIVAPKTDKQGPLPNPVRTRGPIDKKLDSRTIQIFDKGSVRLTTSQNLVVTKQNNYLGFQCYGGLEELCITAKGKVFSTVCMQDRAIADVFSNPEFELPTEPMICKRANCWCEADLLLTKVSPDLNNKPHNHA
jgi:hypothetical protein